MWAAAETIAAATAATTARATARGYDGIRNTPMSARVFLPAEPSAPKGHSEPSAPEGRSEPSAPEGLSDLRIVDGPSQDIGE